MSLVFIEGVSGVGKTTTATLLHDKLRAIGYDVNCYLEGASYNPLDPFDGGFPPTMPLSMFSETYLQRWQDFAKNKTDSILILDGAFFHHQINDLLHFYNASDEVVTNHLSKLAYVIQPFRPVIFYLSSEDVGQRLRQARESRMQSTATDEKIAFWENRKRVDLHVLNRLSIEVHILNVDNSWDTVVETMAKYIRRQRCQPEK